MNISGRFNGKVMAVTGAAQGIGWRVAERAAVEGARLILIDRSRDIHEQAAALVMQGHSAMAVQADLESYAEAERALAEGHAAYTHIDILINNVGGTIWAKPFVHYAELDIEAEVRRSLFPTLWCCRAVLPYMLDAGGGTIVNVSSVATRGIHRVPYAAAKGGVNALTQSLAMEYAEAGIRVVATAPGGTDAPPRRIPRNTAAPTAQEQRWYQSVVDQTVSTSLMKRYGTLDEQAAAILFLASDEASYITGTVLPVAGGDLG
jgi:dihydroxycyclohexadiene carboxylate dehydrogenase